MRLVSGSMRPAALAAAAAIAATVLAATVLTGCPLPYKYTPEGYPGTSTGADPSTPDISASPAASFACSDGASGTILSGSSATVSADSELSFSSATVGAVIYYTKDGSSPDPRSSTTIKYAPDAPCRISLTDTAPRTLRAIAIGPNMKPSQVSTFSISFHFARVAAPVITPDGGDYAEDVTVRLSTATPGAKIYYTLRYGYSGNAPSPSPPAPGEEGTYEYAGPLTLFGPSRNWAIAAIAVKDYMEDSEVASAAYRIACPLGIVEVSAELNMPIADVSGWKSHFNTGIQWGPSVLCIFWTDTSNGMWLIVYDAQMAQVNARKIGNVGTVTSFTASYAEGFPQVYVTSIVDDMVYITYIELGYYVPL
jgi:hypothetical protein